MEPPGPWHDVEMERRAFVVGGVAALAAPFAAEGKVARVGLLGTTFAPPVLMGLAEGLKQRGWIEGQNLVLERRFSEGKAERFPALVAEFIKLNVDVLVTSGGPAAQAAKNATRTVPIVMAAIIDPIGMGLVASLVRPGGNVTGISWLGVDLSVKRLALLKETVPSIARVAVLFNPANPGNTLAAKEMRAAAPGLKLTLHFQELRNPDDFEGALAGLTGARPDALFTVADPLMYRHRAQILDFAMKRRLPAIYEWKEFVELGGLMAYGVNLTELFKHAATFVDKFLKGAKPGDLPVEQVITFELVLNLRTAKALGLTIPQTMLLRADQVIE